MKRLLIVSTDTHFLNGIKVELSYRGFEVMVLQSADDLFKELKNTQPDTLIIDFILDELNGGSLCHQLKCGPDTHNLPVVILSDYTGLERFSSKFGCEDIIYKHADIYKTADALIDVLNKHKLLS